MNTKSTLKLHNRHTGFHTKKRHSNIEDYSGCLNTMMVIKRLNEDICTAEVILVISFAHYNLHTGEKVSDKKIGSDLM